MSGKYGEPWEVNTTFIDPWAVSVTKPDIGEYTHVSVPDEDEIPKLQRVVDCVNACEGVVLKEGASVKELVIAAGEFLQWWEFGELKNRDVRKLGHWLEHFEIESES